MTLITFPGEEYWSAPRWAFARLARATAMFLTDPSDQQVLEAALARDSLSFPLLNAACAHRMARALRQGASWLREELIAENSGEEADEELAMSLTPLSTQLALLISNRRRPNLRPAPDPAPSLSLDPSAERLRTS